MAGAPGFSALMELPDLRLEASRSLAKSLWPATISSFPVGPFFPKGLSFVYMDLKNGAINLPRNTRGRFILPEAISMVMEQCASIWAASILPHCRGDGLQLVDPRDHLVHGLPLKQVLHHFSRTSSTVGGSGPAISSSLS